MQRRFVSFDRSTACEERFDEPDRYRDLLAIRGDQPLAPRGSGLSYVAASFGSAITTIGMRRFSRILGFDAAQRWIDVEAGITVGQVHAFCEHHGLALAVQPGHPQITVGGCIAANVHGKNQFRDGLFGQCVQLVRLFHPHHGFLELSAEQNPEVFELTIGGLGLTGIMASARLSLVPAGSSSMRIEHIPVESLEDATARLTSVRERSEMTYAWLDLMDRRRSGRGYLIVADGVDAPNRPARQLAYAPLDAARARFRPTLLNRATLPIINRAYRYLETRRTVARQVDRAAVLFPAVGKERYFDGYGSRGFVEMQAVVPEPAMSSYVESLRALLRRHDAVIGLTTLKAFRGDQSLLHYTGNGFSFSVDVRQDDAGIKFLDAVDALNCDVGAVTAVIKDSHLSAAVVRRQYRDYDRFKSRLHAFDPARLFASALSRRLDL